MVPTATTTTTHVRHDVTAVTDAPGVGALGLGRHLARTLGAWPPIAGTVTVTTSPDRERPGWDGKVVTAAGVTVDGGTVLSVPGGLVDPVRLAAVDGEAAAGAALLQALGRRRTELLRVVYRWLAPGEPVADADDVGVWRRPDDPDVPSWLRPFNGGVLVASVDGRHAGGVGIKRHDDDVAEIAVVTDPAFRGLGLGRRLVAQAARAILADGKVATYLHLPENVASARLAESVGFTDRGWRWLEP